MTRSGGAASSNHLTVLWSGAKNAGDTNSPKRLGTCILPSVLGRRWGQARWSLLNMGGDVANELCPFQRLFNRINPMWEEVDLSGKTLSLPPQRRRCPVRRNTAFRRGLTPIARTAPASDSIDRWPGAMFASVPRCRGEDLRGRCRSPSLFVRSAAGHHVDPAEPHVRRAFGITSRQE
jgi:hypothetical protein